MRLHPHRDDSGLHDGQAVALHIAVPRGDRGRVDADGTGGLLVSATATEFGLPLGGSVLLSLAGLAAIAILLRRYYPAFA